MNKLLIILADKIDPFLNSGSESDRAFSIEEPIQKIINKVNKSIKEIIQLLNESLVLHQFGNSNAQDSIKQKQLAKAINNGIKIQSDFEQALTGAETEQRKTIFSKKIVRKEIT